MGDKRLFAAGASIHSVMQLQRKQNINRRKISAINGLATPGSGKKLIRCGEYCMLTMQAFLRDHDECMLKRMMTVVVTACEAFRLPVSEAKTEITYLQTLLVGGKLVDKRHFSQRSI